MLVERAKAQGERPPLIAAIDADIEIVTVPAGKTVAQLERGGAVTAENTQPPAGISQRRIDAEGDATDRIGEIGIAIFTKALAPAAIGFRPGDGTAVFRRREDRFSRQFGRRLRFLLSVSQRARTAAPEGDDIALAGADRAEGRAHAIAAQAPDQAGILQAGAHALAIDFTGELLEGCCGRLIVEDNDRVVDRIAGAEAFDRACRGRLVRGLRNIGEIGRVAGQRQRRIIGVVAQRGIKKAVIRIDRVEGSGQAAIGRENDIGLVGCITAGGADVQHRAAVEGCRACGMQEIDICRAPA